MTLSERSTERISILYEAAKSQGSLISLHEIIPLLPERASERELVEAISSSPLLGPKFELRSGFVTEKADGRAPESSLSAELESRKTAIRNISWAAQFLPLMHSTPFRTVAVSGSTSYLSASRSQDLDLFCIAPQGRMWSSFTQALIFARIFSLLRPRSPQICVSCVMDEDYAESAFSNMRDPLFARDALTTIVLRGQGNYRSLLERAQWISDIYPTAYAGRARQTGVGDRAREKPGLLDIIVDRFLFVLVGTFIRMKSSILNRKLARREGRGSLFNLRAGKDHLIYESERYSSLRGAYATVRPE